MGDRCRDMKVFIGSTPMPVGTTPVAAGPGAVITLGIGGTYSLRRPRENSCHPMRRTDRFFHDLTSLSLHGVTRSHRMTSPVSGAVAPAVRKLTCSAISQTRLGEVSSPCP
jgi:hypothetical protein